MRLNKNLWWIIFSTFVPVTTWSTKKMSWKTAYFDGLTSSPALNITGLDSRSIDFITSISQDDKTISSAKAWTGSGLNLSSFRMPSFKYHYFYHGSTCSLYDQQKYQCTERIAGFCPSNHNEYFRKIRTADYFKRWIFV